MRQLRFDTTAYAYPRAVRSAAAVMDRQRLGVRAYNLTARWIRIAGVGVLLPRQEEHEWPLVQELLAFLIRMDGGADLAARWWHFDAAPLPMGMAGGGQLAQHIEADGFALVPDWRHFGLDLSALTQQVQAALAGQASSRGVLLHRKAKLPALSPLLGNESLARVLRAYLRGPVRYDGHAVLRLSSGISRNSYLSSQWHHDRCGRRLKLFIFLHDVDEREGRPTIVARSTHNLSYLFYQGMQASRFADGFVDTHFEKVPLAGPRGGGFLLDTNAIHRGQPDGSRERTTVILEFIAKNKLRGAPRVLRNACPSNPAGPARGRTRFVHYVQDDPAGSAAAGDGIARGRLGAGSEAHLTTQSIAPPPTQPTINISSCPLNLSLSTVVPNGRTECLWQSAVQLYPDAPAGASAICLPIERLPLKDWRSRRVAGTKRGWAPLEKLTVYKLSLCPHLKPFSRLIYIDLGANSYESSIGSWFRVSYPHGDLFDVIAFEPNARFARSYDGKKRLELVQAAAWVANTTVPWSSRRGRSEKSGRIELPSTSAATVTRAVQEGTQSMRAIDIAGMLRERVRPSDYVVLKVGRPLALELTLELTPREPLFSHTHVPHAHVHAHVLCEPTPPSIDPAGRH